MTDLKPVLALGGVAARDETFGALLLTENSGLALASLTPRRGQAIPTPFGLTLPGVSGAVMSDGYGAFWIGPGQWMIEGEGRAESDFAAAVLAEAPGASVTEQTDGFVAIEITSNAGGAPIAALIEKLANVDPRQLTPGTAMRTGLEHMTVFLIRRGEEKLAVIGMRSYAGALWHALEVAAARLAA